MAKTKTVEVKSLDVVSVGKITGLTYVIIGLIIAVFIALYTFFVPPSEGAAVGIIGSLVILVIFPVFYGAAGFVVGVIMAWLYNTIAKSVGGIKVKLK